MKHLFTLLFCISLLTAVKSQTTAPGIQPYGKVDQADLEMKDCDFEKGANAMVLFDYAVMDDKSGLPVGRHTRIKIFNDFGKSNGNFSLEYIGKLSFPGITDLRAETFNYENGKIVITPLDIKQQYKVEVDQWHAALKFAMPNVKAGSIIEISYRQWIPGIWYFQNFIPVRYSQIDLSIPKTLSYYYNGTHTSVVNFKSIPHVKQAFVKSVGEPADYVQIRAMANIHSMPREPYMGSRYGNMESITYIGVNTFVSTWPKIGNYLLRAAEFGDDLNKSLSNESDIIKQAKALKSEEEKIAFIFDAVKSNMQWNGLNLAYTIDGTARAWDKKTGNSAEINIMVYHLLKKAGIKSYPMLVCTKSNGKVNPADPSLYQFNNTVVFVPVDTTKSYVLDASRKEYLYNTIPANILNTFGLSIDPQNNITVDESDKNKAFNLEFISSDDPVMQSVSLNAEIKPEGKIEGDAEITSYQYNKVNALRLYDTIGEAKYIDSLQRRNKDLKINSFAIENAKQDSLPLLQKFNFKIDLPASDGNYIYFNINVLNVMGKNPFYNEERYSDIDFGYRDNYAVYCVYKMPSGYKVDALPKSVTIVMPDQSIVFKRTVAEDDGTILVKYVLNHKKTLYFREEYGDLHGFYNKMYELLNEQIVLKKS